MTQPLSPWDTVKAFVESLSLSDLAWILIGIALVFIFYSIAVRRRRREQATWALIMFWLIAFAGWVFIMYMVAWAKIVVGGVWAIGFLVASAAFLAVTVARLTRQTRVWEKILSGAVFALIGYGILGSFGRGNAPGGYGLVMGLVLGVILGMIVSAKRAMKGGLDRSLDETIEAEGQKKPAKERKVTEI